MPNGPHQLDAAALRGLIQHASARAKVSPQLVAAVIRVESAGDPSAVSLAGAAGLMQLMPATAVAYGAFDRFDPAQNVAAGARYLHDLLARYHSTRLALAAYNAGPSAVDAAHGVPALPETRAYVSRVAALLDRH